MTEHMCQMNATMSGRFDKLTGVVMKIAERADTAFVTASRAESTSSTVNANSKIAVKSASTAQKDAGLAVELASNAQKDAGLAVELASNAAQAINEIAKDKVEEKAALDEEHAAIWAKLQDIQLQITQGREPAESP